MKQAHLRFYGKLNDLLPPWRRGHTTAWTFNVSGSVKDVIEALGVPHTEVDLILANGESVGFAYRVQNEDRISVYPVFETIDISSIERLRPEPLRELRFVADAHLGRLAGYLRMAGFDTVYRNEYEDGELARISSSQGRVLLTRDRGLLKRSAVTHGYCIRETDPRKQFAEVLDRFDLSGSLAPFQRCVHCNAVLQPVPKERVSHRLLPETLQYYDEFSLCPVCDHIYWKGSHYRRMRRFMDGVVGRGSAS